MALLPAKRCSLVWGDLRSTATENVRDCSRCVRPVYRALTEAVLRGYVAAGQCVSISADLAEKVGLSGSGPCVVLEAARPGKVYKKDGSLTPTASARTDYQMPEPFMGYVTVPTKPSVPDEIKIADEVIERREDEAYRGHGAR